MKTHSNVDPPSRPTVRECLAPERVCFLTGKTKAEALDELLALLSPCAAVSDPAELRRSILEREDLMSTGIGQGIGVPHVRIDSVHHMVMALGVHRQGLADYAAMDGAPVRLVVMIVGGPAEHKAYLQLLSLVTHLLKRDDVRRDILRAATAAQVYGRLVQAEAVRRLAD